jgi:hypothetical protein
MAGSRSPARRHPHSSPNDFELVQELRINAVGLDVARPRKQPLRASDPRSMEHRRVDGGPFAPPAARQT